MLGEETVLLKALEGKRGQPEQRPPQPATRGLFGRPTVVQNVQTLAAVPWILVNGAEAFAAIGSKASPGTILVSIRTPAGGGVAEVPIGTPLKDILALAGKESDRNLKAILVGGPRAASCRRPSPTRRTSSRRSGRSAPTSAPARSSPPTSAPASSTWPAF